MYAIIEYSKPCCEIGCIVLYKGYFTFRSWILDQLKLNINNVLTAALLADQNLKKQHCHDDVYEFSGLIRILCSDVLLAEG